MDTELFDTFVSISKTRSFTRTAESMCLTQAAVSARIKQLEVLVGNSVFIRDKTSSTVELTASGKLLLPFAKKFICDWKIVRNEIDSHQNKTSISIGISSSLYSFAVDKILPLVHSIKVNVSMVPESYIVDALVQKEFDVLMTTDKLRVDFYASQVIGTVTFGLLYNHLVRSNCLVTFSWGDEIDEKIDSLVGKFDKTLRVDSISLAHDFIKKYGGSCYLPLIYQEKEIKNNNSYPSFEVPVYVNYEKERGTDDVLRSIIDKVKNF